MVEQALELASQGFHVFPITPRQKAPPITGWQVKATAVAKDVEALWGNAGPDWNIGILMGRASGFIGLDIDFNHGANAAFFEQIPPSWTVKSASGYHVLYWIPKHWGEVPGTITIIPPSKPGDPPAVTLRGTGHYFVAVGSIHPDGKTYEWAKNQGQWSGLNCDILGPGEIELADAPDWFLLCREPELTEDEISRGTGEIKQQRPAREKTYANGRHEMFKRTAVAMRREGREYGEIVERLHYRNKQDCEPPKPNAGHEIQNVAKWAIARVKVQPKKVAAPPADLDLIDQHIKFLGFQDKEHYYISSTNRQLSKINGAHTKSQLLQLMPLEFWEEMFPGKRGPHWDAAESYLLQRSFKVGIFNPQRIRGIGAWNDNDRLALHLGNRLLIDGEEKNLSEHESKFHYKLGFEYASPPPEQASVEECRILVETCKAPHWKNPSSSILFAGQLALLRISGALPWRPHGWLTGPSGCGKTTLLTTLASTMAGEWKLTPQANSTESGIRQQLEVNSIPVIFDEIESEDRRAAARVKGIIELARQSSSEGEGRIFKGTPDGRGLEYKVNSMFLLGSISVNLMQEADLNRFTIYELERPVKGKSGFEFQRILDRVSPGLSDRIFARMVSRYGDLLANYKLLHQKIAEKSTQRHGQQYGMLLAGYSLLIKDGILTEVEAEELAGQIELNERTSDIGESSAEQTCLERLLSSQFRFQAKENEPPCDLPVQKIVDLAEAHLEAQVNMERIGLKLVPGRGIIVANNNRALEPAFVDTAWHKNWKRSLLRIPGAQKQRARFNGGNAVQSVFLPFAAIRPTTPEELLDDGIR